MRCDFGLLLYVLGMPLHSFQKGLEKTASTPGVFRLINHAFGNSGSTKFAFVMGFRNDSEYVESRIADGCAWLNICVGGAS